MKKLEHRAALCLALAGLLLAGLVLFLGRYLLSGADWAAAPFNRHLYTSGGTLSRGTVLDRNGTVLSSVNEDGSRSYPDGKALRRAILHAVGDPAGNISTGALSAFGSKLSGYSLLGGSFSAGTGNQLSLTIDADYNLAAWNALNGRKGTVAVYNYKTGEVLCMVSSPSFDPRNIPDDLETNVKYEGAYLNRFLSSTFTPGSIFKLVTLNAALEQLPDLSSRTWECSGSITIDGETITCTKAHGTQNIQDALANSCNVVFGQLAVELGGKTMEKYVKATGLTRSWSADGISTAAGSFDFSDCTDGNLAWAGVGQYHDAVNPCAMLVYLGAIANGGKAPLPRLIHQLHRPGLPDLPRFSRHTGRLIKADTAQALTDMMANNVAVTYGTRRFPNMDLCAKSGTAEVGSDQKPHAWFVGFLRNPDYPYAFVVLVENGGGGSAVAGDVASAVLKTMTGQ